MIFVLEPIPSMGLVYLPTFIVDVYVNGGKYASPMDAMGNNKAPRVSLTLFFAHFLLALFETSNASWRHQSINARTWRLWKARRSTRPNAMYSCWKTQLVGGFNPSEKYSSKWVHLPQIGMNIKNIWKAPSR